MPISGEEAAFDIAFALSGAISAGAYTAGVLDYFFQAMNAWNQAKEGDPAGTPQHSIGLELLTPSKKLLMHTSSLLV